MEDIKKGINEKFVKFIQTNDLVVYYSPFAFAVTRKDNRNKLICSDLLADLYLDISFCGADYTWFKFLNMAIRMIQKELEEGL